MNIALINGHHPHEQRVPMIPEDVSTLIKQGASVTFESGLGRSCHYEDKDYQGAVSVSSREELLSTADVIVRIRKPHIQETALLKAGCLHISYLDPFNNRELVEALAARGVSAVSVEMIPRTAIAQKMDVLSSQASLAGYAAVVTAAERMRKVFPMMITPAGTIAPARVFVIGAGVAGLQAIATARRLGAVVEAFDTRPAVAEQILSLGARFVKIDLGETGQTASGYAKELTPEQMEKQRQAMTRHCAASDVVIATAQVFGRRAPLLVTGDMIRAMRPGSVAVDLAVESGGNVEGSRMDEEVDRYGVRIIGIANMPGKVAIHASQVLSRNFLNLLQHFLNEKTSAVSLSLEDDITRSCLITHQGEIINEMVRNAWKGPERPGR